VQVFFKFKEFKIIDENIELNFKLKLPVLYSPTRIIDRILIFLNGREMLVLDWSNFTIICYSINIHILIYPFVEIYLRLTNICVTMIMYFRPASGSLSKSMILPPPTMIFFFHYSRCYVIGMIYEIWFLGKSVDGMFSFTSLISTKPVKYHSCVCIQIPIKLKLYLLWLMIWSHVLTYP